MRHLSGGGPDGIVEQKYRRVGIDRGEAEPMQENGARQGGSTATIEREAAEAIQVNRAARGTAVRRQ